MSDLPVPPVPVDVDALTAEPGWVRIDKLKRPQLEMAYHAAIDTRDRALAEVVTLRAENAGLDGLVDAMSDNFDDDINDLTVERDSWRVRAVTAEARIAEIQALYDEWHEWPTELAHRRAPIPWISFFGLLNSALDRSS